MTAEPPIQTVSRFLLETPLYTSVELDKNSLSFLYSHGKIDGYCPSCGKETTFKIRPQHIPGGDPDRELKAGLRNSYDEMGLNCSRNDAHCLHFYIRIRKNSVIKIGQYPSLADIAISEIKAKYKAVLKGDNWTELYKAIGLAAHGEGIGAFVYLRRVFENLIFQRFDQYKDAEKWDEEYFRNLRMNERVAFLKGHLPDYLVEISKIYSIFSKGIHELKNEDCLKFFQIGKSSILIILEDDLKIKEDLDRRAQFKKEIAEFGSEEAA